MPDKAKTSTTAAAEKADDDGAGRALASHGKRIGKLEDRVDALVAKLNATLNLNLADD